MKTSNRILTSTIAIICTFILAGLIYAKRNTVSYDSKDSSPATKSSDLTSFNSLMVIGNFDIVIKSGSPHMDIDADEETMKRIKTENKDGKLIISMSEQGIPSHSNSGVHIVIQTNTNLEDIHSTGNSDIEMETISHADQFEISLIGNGEINSQSESKTISATMTGNGLINHKGKSENTNLNLIGNGELDFLNTISQNVEVGLMGNGSCSVYSEVKITGNLTGNGELHHKGPGMVDVSKLGNGEIIAE